MSYLGGGPGQIYLPPPGGSIDLSQMNPATQSQVIAGGWRNRTIGGCCRVNQRPSIAVTQANGSGIYGGPDHFQCYNLGSAANGQFTQKAGTINFNNVVRPAVQQNVDTPIVNFAGAGNLWGGFVNRIEGYDCFDLMGRSSILSFIYFSNVPGVHSVAILTANYSLVSTFISTGIPQYVALPLPALPTDAGIPISNVSGISIVIDRINTGSNSTSNLNVWQSGTWVNAPNQVNWGATGGNWNLLAELQLEVGTIATPFERRPYAVEMAMCQRYRQQNYIVNNGYMGNAVDNNRNWNVGFTQSMRQTPVITVVLSAGSFVLWGSGANGFNGGVAAGNTTSNVSMTSWTAEAEY
jgi:hypothetical protein